MGREWTLRGTYFVSHFDASQIEAHRKWPDMNAQSSEAWSVDRTLSWPTLSRFKGNLAFT